MMMKWKEKLKEDWYRDNYFPIKFEKDEEWERMDRNANIVYGYIKRFPETPEEWISVDDNSNGFRDYLDFKGIEYKRNGHFTMVRKDVNLYWLGRQVEEWKQLQKPNK